MAGGAGLEALPMRAEFTAARDSKVRYALVLTERELSVQRLADNRSTGARAITVFDLDDCIGCSVHGTEDEADPGACFSVYLYPVRSRCALTSPPSRRRVERRFRVMQSPDPRSNLEEAHRWARAIREGSIRNGRSGAVVGEVRRPCRFLLLINPQSGKGQALSLFHRHVQSMLQEACITYTLIVTEHQNHAREKVREADLSQWDALVIMSGDGLLFEVVNGLMEREDWEQAIQTPLGVLPGGSGNALAASMHYYTGSQLVSDEDLLVNSCFMLCKGLVSSMDLTSVCMASSQRLFSFLSLAWGFVADVDIESEKYRHIGKFRFTMGTLARLLSLRVYRGTISYLPAEESQTPTALLSEGPASVGSSSAQSDNHPRTHTLHNSCNSNNALKSKRSIDPASPTRGPPDSLLVPLDQPVPAHWTVVKDEEFILVLAVYQSHIAEDLIAAPASRLDDGMMHLIYVRAGISRLALLRLFLAMAKGTHLSINCPFVVYVKARALRLEPHTPNGTMTVDGEQVEYGPVQAQIYGSLARVIAR